MSIPVHVSAVRVFDDRVDLMVRGADGVLVNLRLSVAVARELAVDLRCADSMSGARRPGTLDHPPTPVAAEVPFPVLVRLKVGDCEVAL